MKWLIIIISPLFSLSCTSANLHSAEQILLDKVIVASKINDSNTLSVDDYDKISEYISLGRTRWIELYPLLNKAPFLGETSFQEGLDIAMAYALPENPPEVLKFVDESNVDKICGMPFIEPNQDEIKNYLSQTRIALGKLPAGLPWKSKCMSNLNKFF